MILGEFDTKDRRAQCQLAASSGCEPPTIIGSACKLKATGPVVHRTSTTDRLVTIVELGDCGHTLMPALSAV